MIPIAFVELAPDVGRNKSVTWARPRRRLCRASHQSNQSACFTYCGRALREHHRNMYNEGRACRKSSKDEIAGSGLVLDGRIARTQHLMSHL